MTTPIDSGRYGSDRMHGLFRDEYRYRLYVRVEGALAAAQGRHGAIPPEAAELISERSRDYRCDLERVSRSEEVTRHELFSVVNEFAEACAPHQRYVHYGATSSDILDTALALQLSEALDVLEERLRKLLTVLIAAISRNGQHVMIGRTHGQHAQPVTLGFKLAIWLAQLGRCLRRLNELRGRAVMGKVAGAVGSLAGFGPHGLEIERDTLIALGLPEPEICAQAVARDRIAEFMCWAGLTATCLDNLATEVRNLQRTEIGEVAETFHEGDQIGSSAMPHKRNPVLSERVCSLARLVRSLIGPALENVVTWHERDLANSANERFTLPEACILLDEMLITSASVVENLRAFPDRMADNLGRSRNAHLSEAVLLRLVNGGMDRLTAYRLIQEATARAATEKLDLMTVLAGDRRVSGIVDEHSLTELAAPGADVGRCRELAAVAVEDCQRLLKEV
ncbi:adenylosuccinate lyase [Streptomyces ossamyceticus]|uniref:adenylosuccinate lyase n=1 Tax=Streptomyces TaxID=1883 RepID=UPI0006E271D4|nr:adenylosuccinate lyase [Streptomyces neyagawaensis]MCL6739229.1 adenylosuccinate lyase [Streptomyces neyagawaensis]MDE1688825.1 adenylosuccinate lyase [Streptomyces neyagawaensis]